MPPLRFHRRPDIQRGKVSTRLYIASTAEPGEMIRVMYNTVGLAKCEPSEHFSISVGRYGEPGVTRPATDDECDQARKLFRIHGSDNIQAAFQDSQFVEVSAKVHEENGVRSFWRPGRGASIELIKQAAAGFDLAQAE
jgi:hypothetical protein